MFQKRVVDLAGCLMGLLLLSAMPGCGGSGDRVTVHPVRGVVTFQGKPMAGGGSIAFLPLEVQAGKGAGGEIDAQGKFVMSTYGDGDGSMPGKFRVVITQSVWDEPDYQGDSDANPNAATPQAVKRVKDDEVIPAIYSHAQNSPLMVEIGPDSPAEITLELTNSPGR